MRWNLLAPLGLISVWGKCGGREAKGQGWGRAGARGKGDIDISKKGGENNGAQERGRKIFIFEIPFLGVYMTQVIQEARGKYYLTLRLFIIDNK